VISGAKGTVFPPATIFAPLRNALIGIVLLPTITLASPTTSLKAKVFPPITALPPPLITALRGKVFPPITALGPNAAVWPPNTILKPPSIEARKSAMARVLDPIITLEPSGRRLMAVPEIVMMPPGFRVEEPRIYFGGVVGGGGLAEVGFGSLVSGTPEDGGLFGRLGI
jgi:hypothetical protein